MTHFKRNLLTLTLTASLSFNLNQTTPSFSLLSLSLSSSFPSPARESGHPLHTANLSLSIQTCLSPLSFSFIPFPKLARESGHPLHTLFLLFTPFPLHWFCPIPSLTPLMPPLIAFSLSLPSVKWERKWGRIDEEGRGWRGGTEIWSGEIGSLCMWSWFSGWFGFLRKTKVESPWRRWMKKVLGRVCYCGCHLV